jgi:DNA-binding HxlR family transcriptional regulator
VGTNELKRSIGVVQTLGVHRQFSVVEQVPFVAGQLELANTWFFDDFVDDLHISQGILTDRLATLVEHEIVERGKYQENPDRFENRLSPRGRELFPAIMAMMKWGDRWLSTPAVGGAPVVVRHHACGNDINGPQRCSG